MSTKKMARHYERNLFLHFQSGTDKRSADEVNTACEYLINAVQERFSDQGVRLRG